MIPTLNCKYRKLTKREIIHILNHSDYCLLGTSGNNQSYIVPMYYEYKLGFNSLTFTMFSLHEGQKMDNMMSNEAVCLEFNFPVGDKLQTVIAIGTVTMTPAGYDPKCDSPIYKMTIDISQITGREYKLRHHHSFEC